MDKKTWNKILNENTLNEGGNDFVASYQGTVIIFNNTSDKKHDHDQKLYDKLVALIKKMKNKPKKIEITF